MAKSITTGSKSNNKKAVLNTPFYLKKKMINNSQQHASEPIKKSSAEVSIQKDFGALRSLNMRIVCF